MFLNANNIYQMLQLLGLPKSTTYNRVKNVSVYSWRQLVQHRLYEVAIPLVLARLTKSDATKSRDGLILAVDDTVIARIATELGYVWRWWSGQLKRVTHGQNVIALILVIGDIILWSARLSDGGGESDLRLSHTSLLHPQRQTGGQLSDHRGTAAAQQ